MHKEGRRCLEAYGLRRNEQWNQTEKGQTLGLSYREFQGKKIYDKYIKGSKRHHGQYVCKMRNWIGEIETINENKMEMLEMRNTTSEVNHPFDRMENKLDKVGKRINELENRTIGISLNENVSGATEMFYMFFSVTVTQCIQLSNSINSNP